jgi:hypothetical protein
MTNPGQCFNFSLEFQAQLVVDDKILSFQFLHSDIGKLVLSLVDYSSCTFSNLFWIAYLFQINDLRTLDRMIKKLHSQVLLFIVNIWDPLTFFLPSLLSFI